MTEPEIGELLLRNTKSLLKQFETIQTDTDHARFDFLRYPSPHVDKAVEQLRTLWWSLGRFSSDGTYPEHPKSAKTHTHAAQRSSVSRAPNTLDDFPHPRELANLIEKEAELLSHVASLLDHNNTPVTPNHPGVSPIVLLESETREKLKQLSEADWWLTQELKHELRKKSDKDVDTVVTRSLGKAIARNLQVQAELRRELHTARKEHALAHAEDMFQCSAKAAQDADSDFAAFRDACRLTAARYDMQRHQGALKRRARVMARDGEALRTRETEDAARSIAEKAEKVSELVGSLQGRVVDDGVRDAIEALRETSRTRRL